MKNVIGFVRRAGILVGIFAVVIALIGIATKGLTLDFEFTGGYMMEFSSPNTVEHHQMVQKLQPVIGDEYRLKSLGDGHNWLLQLTSENGLALGNQWMNLISNALGDDITILDADFLDSQVGAEMLELGGLALFTSILCVLGYLLFRFDWRFAVSSVLALIHDLIIIIGLFAWFEITVDLAVIAALLAIVGYSLNDSIVVADRVRENLWQAQKDTIGDIVDSAISSTLTRTLITSGTTLVTVCALWTSGVDSLFGFAAALFAGIVVGTLSSISISASLPQWLGITGRVKEETDPMMLEP